MKNGKEFLIKTLKDGSELTAKQLLDKWVVENEVEFSNRLKEYIKNGKEKNSDIKFTMGQINAELLGLLKDEKLFDNKIIIRYNDTDNANFRIITDKVYLLK